MPRPAPFYWMNLTESLGVRILPGYSLHHTQILSGGFPWLGNQGVANDKRHIQTPARLLGIWLPTQEIQVWSLVWEDPLEKEMATHSSSLAWEIPWTEEPGSLQSNISDYLPCVAKLLYMEVPPCLLWGVLLGLLEILLPGLDVLKIPTKQNLTLNF